MDLFTCMPTKELKEAIESGWEEHEKWLVKKVILNGIYEERRMALSRGTRR